MKRLFAAASIMALLLFCSGCSDGDNVAKEQPSYGLTGEVAPSPNTGSADSEGPTDSDISDSSLDLTVQGMPEPTANEITVGNLQFYATELSVVYSSWGNPIFYPVNEASLELLRTVLEKNAERAGSVKLNPHKIIVGNDGFGVAMDQPLDAWGNEFVIWFNNDPETGYMKISIASAGPDGAFTYRGTGEDYSQTGFGDDIIVFSE